eukprot:7607090-Prorocentrum_lima.AAC.1
MDKRPQEAIEETRQDGLRRPWTAGTFVSADGPSCALGAADRRVSQGQREVDAARYDEAQGLAGTPSEAKWWKEL